MSKGRHGIRVDITGQRFGRLIAISITSYNIKTGRRKWLCRCDCGKTTEVNGTDLRNGHTKSCGCLHRETSSKLFKTHGKKHTRLYIIWCGMRQRCRDKNCNRYQSYGGRGIKVCESWEKDFTAFETWALNNGYADNLSIDRIDINGNYEPSNCRWADNFTQGNNTRNNIFITFGGETHTVIEWARIKGLKSGAIYYRFHRGYKPEEAIFGKKRSKV